MQALQLMHADEDEDDEDDWDFEDDVVIRLLPHFDGLLRHFHWQRPNEDHLSWVEASANPILQYFAQNPRRHLETFELAGKNGIIIWRTRLDVFLNSNPWLRKLDLSGVECPYGDEGDLYIDFDPSSLPMLQYLRLAPPIEDIILNRDMPHLKSVSVYSYGLNWLDRFHFMPYGPFPHVESFEIELVIQCLE